jgi:hypothetical protein
MESVVCVRKFSSHRRGLAARPFASSCAMVTEAVPAVRNTGADGSRALGCDGNCLFSPEKALMQRFSLCIIGGGLLQPAGAADRCGELGVRIRCIVIRWRW